MKVRRRVRTSTFLPHPPEEVWRVLADFAAFPEWNPLVLKVEGLPGPGTKLWITIARPDKPGSVGRMKVRIEAWEPPRALAWRGKIWPFFDGLHWFRLTPDGPGTRLDHGEDMGGLYPLLLGERRIAGFAPHYEAVNRALGRRLAKAS